MKFGLHRGRLDIIETLDYTPIYCYRHHQPRFSILHTMRTLTKNHTTADSSSRQLSKRDKSSATSLPTPPYKTKKYPTAISAESKTAGGEFSPAAVPFCVGESTV